jgi:quaternary ammonium compound-resistance protein SugE
MSWIYLLLAGVFEIVWAVCLKYCDGFKPTVALFSTISASLLSITFLGLAIREIPMGTAYAIWTGMGVIGITVYGMMFLGESRDTFRIILLSMIVFGTIGLKVFSK